MQQCCPQHTPTAMLQLTILVHLPRIVNPQVDGRAWTNLLELQWLACLLHVNFIIFSALPSPGSRSGRKIAYYIQHRRDMRIGGPMHSERLRGCSW